MFISYFDESGDDGYPKYSSEIFVLSSLYFHYSNWQKIYNQIHSFRKSLKQDYNLLVKEELHAKEFVTDKDPYHGRSTPSQRHDIIFKYFEFISQLEIKIIIVAIDKLKIKRPEYNVLKNALTYNIQRIENDLNFLGNEAKFMIITDEGRVGKMRNTTREIQRINFIPSRYNNNSGYRNEIKNLIEDPLPKSSSQSHFIQLADMISFVAALYVKQNLCTPKINWANRVYSVFDEGEEIELLKTVQNRLNLKASRSNEFGIVYYPK